MTDRNRLLEILGTPALRFSASVSAGPVVYAWIRDGRALYIGSSKSPARPVLLSQHHRLFDVRDIDSVFVWRCGSMVDAIRLEKRMIAELRPVLNGTWTTAPDALVPVRISKSLARRLRLYAARIGKPISMVASEIIKEYLDEKDREAELGLKKGA